MRFIADLIRASAHLLAAIGETIIDFAMLGILSLFRWMGPASWIFSLLLVLLTLWSWKKGFRFGNGWTVGAEIFLPFLCGGGYFLMQEQFWRDLMWLYDEGIPPAAWGMFLLLGMWTLYLCLLPLWKYRRSDGDLTDLERAERLLREGSVPAAIVWAWCGVILMGIFLLSTVGILFSLILGGLIAQKNALWEYGTTGLLAGLGLLYLLQLVYLVQGALLLRGIALEGKRQKAVWWILVPGLSFFKAQSLLAKLQRKKREKSFTYLK